MLRRILLILLQVVVTTAAILYVFHDPGKRAEIGGALRRADKTWIALGCVCYACVEIAATVRWHLLLGIQQISLGWFRTGAIVIIGLFFNVFLPGSGRRRCGPPVLHFQARSAEEIAWLAFDCDGSVARTPRDCFPERD